MFIQLVLYMCTHTHTDHSYSIHYPHNALVPTANNNFDLNSSNHRNSMSLLKRQSYTH